MSDLRVTPRTIALIDRLYNPDNLNISQDTRLYSDLGIMPKKMIELVMDIEDLFDVAIPEHQFENFETIGNIISFVNQAKYKS